MRDLRDEKCIIRDRLIEKRNMIHKIQKELPEEMHKVGPDIPDIDESEFSEENLKPKVIIPTETIEPTEMDVKQPMVKVGFIFRIFL